LFFALRPRNEGKSRRLASLFLFGPFGPTIDSYLAKRGGFTKREWIGWGIVVLVGILAIVFTPASRGV
jgi:hypothetical protein